MGPKALGRRRRVSRELTQAWIEVAGTEIANQTRVRGLRRGVLTIEVESSPLCHQLASFRRDDLLLALQARVRRADVMEIRFRAGPLA